MFERRSATFASHRSLLTDDSQNIRGLYRLRPRMRSAQIETYRGIRITAKRNMLTVQAHNPEQEEAEEEIEVSYEGNDLEVGFNVNYLLDALAAIDGQDVELGLTDSNSSCLIRSPGNTSARYVVMPMRL